MTVLSIVGLIILYFVVPYLTGNVYGLIFRKKSMGIAATYLSGMAVVYAALTIIQLAVVKFKFDFQDVVMIYHLLFGLCILLGIVGFFVRMLKDKAIRWDIEVSKKSLWIFGIILLQGILYVVLKNPYFEDNALLETARVTLETGTVYQYNAFTGNEAVAGFPLSNKLMFLPMLYAYISKLTGLDMALIFNFVLPVVTFISFYLVMVLWLQQVSDECKVKWETALFMLVWIVQVGDGWNHATVFRVLHSGYTGEAIFFGVLAAYSLYAIKNKSYFITVLSVAAFPGLVKYDAVIDLVKSFGMYRAESAFYTGMMLIYVLALIYWIIKEKKITTKLFNLNLIIVISAARIWNQVVYKENNLRKKMINGAVILLVLFMCGNVKLISDETEWRSNSYGAGKKEYELLKVLEDDSKVEVLKLAACDEVAKWIKRLDFEIEPVIGYDLGGREIWWYSYEKYDEAHNELWQNVNIASVDSEQELMRLTEEIEVDYIVVRRITDLIPIRNNEKLQCVYDGPSYLVYFVDKN